jgi:hypothetical protein
MLRRHCAGSAGAESSAPPASALYGLDGPGQSTPLGTIGRPIRGVGVSADLSRATITEMDYRADAWANKVVVH